MCQSCCISLTLFPLPQGREWVWNKRLLFSSWFLLNPFQFLMILTSSLSRLSDGFFFFFSPAARHLDPLNLPPGFSTLAAFTEDESPAASLSALSSCEARWDAGSLASGTVCNASRYTLNASNKVLSSHGFNTDCSCGQQESHIETSSNDEMPISADHRMGQSWKTATRGAHKYCHNIYFASHRLTLLPGGPGGPASPDGPGGPWKQASKQEMPRKS